MRDGSCGRRRFADSAHRLRSPVFSPAQEPHDPRLWISEDATDPGLRTETDKPVRIIQPSLFSHPAIMPDSSHRREAKTALKGRALSPSDALYYPHALQKSPFLM